MKRTTKILSAAIGALLFPVANASPFFIPCNEALTTKPFRPLQEFFASQPDQTHQTLPDYCFRLNDQEFLLTAMGGRAGEGLIYFNASNGTYVLADGGTRANLTINREFDGPNGRHFAIMETSNLTHGDWGVGYELLFLKPGGGPRAFGIQSLVWGAEDPESGMCGSRIKEGVATSIKNVEVMHEGRNDATLVFTVDEQKCPDGKQRTYERRFKWASDQFVEAADEGEPCQGLFEGSTTWARCESAHEAATKEERLNDAYEALKNELALSDHPEEERNLRQAERAWIGFRESECLLRKTVGGGVAGGPDAVYTTCLGDLAKERTGSLIELTRIMRQHRTGVSEAE